MTEGKDEPSTSTIAEPYPAANSPGKQECNKNESNSKAQDKLQNENENSEEFVFPVDNKDSPPLKSAEKTEEEKEEVLYASLPPQLNVELLGRATRTDPKGCTVLIKKTQDGKLRITYKVGAHLTDKEVACIACSRAIGKDELYLNFPDDLDRRRLWGNALGFKYNEILRLRITNGYSIASIGHICTDHFSEECFRKYNFNKAAIESFGMPIASSTSSPGTPVKKRTPWDCTVCTFKCYSVAEMHAHLSEHAKIGKDDRKVRDALFDKGIICPFCRRCTYGYKTLSGLQRHLQVEPIAHFYLKRIHEVAAKNCRSSTLEPINEWSSWTESNVFYAYHGCDVPTKTPTKRSMLSPSAPSEEKKAKSPATDQNDRVSKPRRTAARKLDLSAYQIPSKAEDEHEDNEKAGDDPTIEMSDRYAARIKSLLPPETIITNDSQNEFVVGNTQNLAHALRLVTEEDGFQDEDLIFEDPTLPSLFSNIDQRELLSKQRKTARQLESNEARLRLFGDSDVPRGYKKVDGPGGPRLVPAYEKKSWRERFAPDVLIKNRRFLPLN